MKSVAAVLLALGAFGAARLQPASAQDEAQTQPAEAVTVQEYAGDPQSEPAQQAAEAAQPGTPAQPEAAEAPQPAEPAQPAAEAPQPAEPAAVPEPAPAAPAPALAEPKPAAEDTPADPNAFDLNRETPIVGSPLAAGSDAAPRTSFWGRLFGRRARTEPAPIEPEAEAGPEAPAAIPGTQPAAPVAAAPSGGEPSTPEAVMAAQEEVRRQAREVEALLTLRKAEQAKLGNEFAEAVKLYNRALSILPQRPQTVELRQDALSKMADCEYRTALAAYKEGKTAEAKEAIRRSLEYAPTHTKAASLNDRITADEAARARLAEMPVPPRRSPEHLDRTRQIATFIDLGRQYYAIGEYEMARREFKNALTLDEKNEEAAVHLKRVYDKLYNLETDQMKRQQAEMVAQVRDTWTPPVKRESVGPERPSPDAAISGTTKRKLLDKLNNIVIPQLEFRQANIVDVVKYIDQASIQCDKESPQGEKGVNFILRLRRSFNGGAPMAEEASAGVDPDAASVPTVTLSLRNIVLMDAIKYITEVTGLKYRIEENVVVIVPSDAVFGDLVTRTYKVQPSIAETIMGASMGGAGGLGTELGLAAAPAERGDVKQFFVDAGVPFPEGTSIAYKPSLNLLIVKNTADNLESFERILSSLNVVPIQVEIEARFVEVAQQDLEELGIEWMLTDNWELAYNAGGAALPMAARERIQVNRNTMSKGLRNLVSGASGISAAPGGDLAGILSISSVLTNPEVSMILHALEQRSGANLLSAPKVTTKSGANAEIKVVKELIYPTEFEVTEPTVSGDSGTVTRGFVTPASFQTRDTGVILNVTPTVGPDGFSIDLVMLPQVVELSDWINYGSTLVEPTTGREEFYSMPQPIFHSRNIMTSITIWDGQTVVMGGLITEQQTTTEDKIPILGDIPLLGYLFRSKTTNSQKFNLLIFVTANLVDPAGNKINKELIATAAGTAAPPAAPTAAP